MPDDAFAASHDTTRAANGRFGRGNPGRPPGARSRVSYRVVASILEDFENNQKAVLGALRKFHLVAYANLISRLLPRGALDEALAGGIGDGAAAELSAADLVELIEAARETLVGIEARQSDGPVHR